MLIGQPVTVLGAGIAGLAVARALALRGAKVTVHERAGALGEVGGGLQIAPNGLAVLDALGLGAEARAASVRAAEVRLTDGLWDRPVTRLDLVRHGRGRDWLLFHRADLVALLAQGAEAAGVELRLGEAAEPVEDRADGVRFSDGSTASLAIGAEGLHSASRALLNGRTEPFFTGQTAWRAVIPEPEGGAPAVEVFLGPGQHLVTYPLRGTRWRNIVAVQERADWTAEGWSHRDDPAHLRDAFAGFAPRVESLLARVEEVHLWGLFRHPVAARWHGQRLAILGDAAHPTLPFLAQGANMALEDAWVLAACLADETSPAAFARYQAQRVPRVTRAIAAANANARAYHLRGLPRWAAHRALKLGGLVWPAGALRRFDWLHGFDVTRS